MNQYKVLCVDDELNVLSSLKRLLRKESYEFITASNPIEGLALLNEYKDSIGVVISDQKMAAMEGVGFVEKVKKVCPDAVRVFLSGYADVALMIELINKGEIYRFLSKPWDDDNLKLEIGLCLERYKMVLENKRLNRCIALQNEELKLLNGDLETTVLTRTKSLELSQEIVYKLPVPVIGVDRDKKIIISNEVAHQMFSFLDSVMPGTHVEDVFDVNFEEELDEMIESREESKIIETCCDRYSIAAKVSAVYSSEVLRGFAIVLEILGSKNI